MEIDLELIFFENLFVIYSKFDWEFIEDSLGIHWGFIGDSLRILPVYYSAFLFFMIVFLLQLFIFFHKPLHNPFCRMAVP